MSYLTQRFGKDKADFSRITETGLNEAIACLQEREIESARKLLSNMVLCHEPSATCINATRSSSCVCRGSKQTRSCVRSCRTRSTAVCDRTWARSWHAVTCSLPKTLQRCSFWPSWRNIIRTLPSTTSSQLCGRTTNREFKKGMPFPSRNFTSLLFFQRDRSTGFDWIERFWAFHRHNVALRRCFRQKQCDVRRIAVGDVTEFPGRLASLQLFPARMGSKFRRRNETATASSSRVAAPKRLVDADVSNSASQ